MGGLFGGAPSMPQNVVGPPPPPPDPELAARVSQYDQQKANAIRSDPITNTGGAMGILTDTKTTYKKPSVLGAS
jgi:hypothetical protein